MYKNFKTISEIVGRCPSCVKNLRNVFCFMTCDPHQSKFLSPNKTEVITGETPTEVITELDYYIDEEFAQNMFDSCSEVTMPSSNIRPITMMCGKWGELCNADR